MAARNLFSPEIMAQFGRTVIPFNCQNDGDISGEFLHWTGTYSAFLDLVAACLADKTPAGLVAREKITEECPSRWSGVDNNIQTILAQRFIGSAFESFKRAEGKLEADRFQPSATRPVVSGPVWIVPQVLAGNARPARLRERTKLPPKNIVLALSVSGGVEQEDITAAIAKVARGCWDYVQAGGAVTLTVNYTYQFQPEYRVGEIRGVIFSLRVPLTNQAAFATAASAQLYRGLAMGLRDGLQGRSSGPVARSRVPGVVAITGNPRVDAQALAAIGVR